MKFWWNHFRIVPCLLQYLCKGQKYSFFCLSFATGTSIECGAKPPWISCYLGYLGLGLFCFLGVSHCLATEDWFTAGLELPVPCRNLDVLREGCSLYSIRCQSRYWAFSYSCVLPSIFIFQNTTILVCTKKSFNYPESHWIWDLGSLSIMSNSLFSIYLLPIKREGLKHIFREPRKKNPRVNC